MPEKPKIIFGVYLTWPMVQKIMLFYQYYKNNHPSYLSDTIPQRNSAFNARNVDEVPLINIKHNFFKNYFSPLTIIEWNKLDPNL